MALLTPADPSPILAGFDEPRWTKVVDDKTKGDDNKELKKTLGI